jgi:acyl-CoA thioester hydrolase
VRQQGLIILEHLDSFLLRGLKIQIGIILGFHLVKYIVPLTYPDTVYIGTEMEEIRDHRIVLKSFYQSEKS